MSDVSKTNDLIGRLRNGSGAETAGVNERVALMDEAADALEAATRDPVQGERTVNANCMTDADGCEAGTEEPNAKRLFADFKPSCSCMSSFDGEGDGACEVHREGEPNDDGELIEKIAGTIAVNDLLMRGITWGDLIEKHRESYRITARDVFSLAAHATVPDAATAALERVRAAVEKHKHWNEDCGWDVPAIEVLAALDGAPEPEPCHEEHVTVAETWPRSCLDWECDHRNEDGQPEDMSACKSRPMEVCMDCMVESGLPRHPNQWEDAGLTEWPCENVRPALPVEGDSK